jgi:hypothetical protein
MTRLLSVVGGTCGARRALGAVVLLAAQLVAVGGTPMVLSAAAIADGDFQTTICNCIHDPDTTCPMHGGSRQSAPRPGSGPHWSGCDGPDEAALIGLVTTVGIPVFTQPIVPSVRSLGPVMTGPDAVLDSSVLPSLPPPRA